MTLRRPLALLAAVAVFLALCGLGSWQLQRLAWKRALIARVQAQLDAPAQPAPEAALWTQLGPGDEYRKLQLQGQYLPVPDTFVQALSRRGAGYWVISALATDQGTILVNRGFTPERQATPPPSGPVTLTGVLRLTQPGGGFLRRNDPAAGRWFSRDTAAIAAALGLGPVAPWFVDAGVPGQTRPALAAQDPVPGLTVVQFHNSHLGYAATWFSLALLWAFGLHRLWRHRS